MIINEHIRAREVLLIGDDGEKYGVKPTKEALELAYDHGFDLVMVAPKAKPPVCKMMDYNKYRYEQQQKEKEAKKHQKTMELKEIRMSAVIEEHDFNTKLRNGRKFLDKGNKVKLSVRLPYRARRSMAEQGKDVLRRFAEKCSDLGEIETKIHQDGRYINTVLAPKK